MQWRSALPAQAQHFSGMNFIGRLALCSHTCHPNMQQHVKDRSIDLEQPVLGPISSRLQPTISHLSCSAHRQAAQIHSCSSGKRRRGLQSHVKETDPSQNGTKLGSSIPSSGASSSEAASPSAIPGRRSNSQPIDADDSQSVSASRQAKSPSRPLQPSYMPPHLFTARRRELQQGNGQHDRGPPPGSRVLSVDDSKAAEQQLKATLPPVELEDLGEKAEGVIQIGTSGMRIPLYGKSMQSIQEVCAPFSACTRADGRIWSG